MSATPEISKTANTALVFGSTGAVGSQIYETLLKSASRVTTISRRLPAPPPAGQSQNIQNLQAESSAWATMIPSVAPTVVYNAVGTTRAASGLDGQWKIDHDLCIELARAAKEVGVRTHVFISSAGTRTWSFVPYSKMKIGVEDAIRELGFEQAVILRPGMILNRGDSKNPTAEWIVNSLPAFLRDRLGQDKTVIAKAAVVAERLASEGKAPSKYWILEQKDVVRLGSTA